MSVLQHLLFASGMFLCIYSDAAHNITAERELHLSVFMVTDVYGGGRPIVHLFHLSVRVRGNGSV